MEYLYRSYYNRAIDSAKTKGVQMKKAVFFDRDGVINKDLGYIYRQEDFVFNEGIFQTLRFCKERGFLLFVITNQSGIGRGYYTLEDFKALTAYMQQALKSQLGFGFDSIYFCPHDPKEDCICRKPKPGMIAQAKKDYELRLRDSFIIGDKLTDMQAGERGEIGHKILIGKLPKEDQKREFKSISNLHIISSTQAIQETMQAILG